MRRGDRAGSLHGGGLIEENTTAAIGLHIDETGRKYRALGQPLLGLLHLAHSIPIKDVEDEPTLDQQSNIVAQPLLGQHARAAQ